MVVDVTLCVVVAARRQVEEEEEEEEMKEVCGVSGQPVARHTLKQNNIVISITIITSTLCNLLF